jgi:hypothetical protein
LLASLLEQVFGCFPYFKPTMLGTTNKHIELTDITLDIFSHVGKGLTRLTGFILIRSIYPKKYLCTFWAFALQQNHGWKLPMREI